MIQMEIHKPKIIHDRNAEALPPDSPLYGILRKFGLNDPPNIYPEVIHPHIEEEKPHLYHTVDGDSTELEVLQYLHGIVSASKPELVLETGTYRGLGTLAIASALAENKKGKIVSVEYNNERVIQARKLIAKAGLEDRVDIINKASLDYIAKLPSGIFFNLVFFDTELDIRADEFYALQKGNHLRDGSILFFHDTSRLRGVSIPHEVQVVEQYTKALDEITAKYCRGDFEMPFSRGFKK